MSRSVLPVFLSALISVGSIPIAFAASNEPQLNFKIYSPEPATTPTASETPATSDTPAAETTATETPQPAATAPSNDAIIPAMENGTSATTPSTPAETEATTPSAAMPEATPEIKNSVEAPAVEPTAEPSAKPTLRSETPVEAQPKAAEAETSAEKTTTAADTDKAPKTDAVASDTETKTGEAATTDAANGDKVADNKTLQGYIRVVPSGTKIPIIMDTAVDSETSQEGDEFTARTAEDLNIDGGVAVPAGSIIKGRIAQMNAPRHVDRSGSVALKFDTVTTPDNRQIPLVANLVAHGGVVHAKRGMKDIAIDSGTIALPLLLGLGIGALAGNSKNSTSSTSTSSSSITKPEAAMIGAGIGLVVGVAILIAKKGKKVDVRPGDEMKIELAEDLRMPMM